MAFDRNSLAGQALLKRDERLRDHRMAIAEDPGRNLNITAAADVAASPRNSTSFTR